MWSVELKELKNLHNNFKGKYPKLDKELGKLFNTDDENIVLIYARRCLEVIITKLCEIELGRPRGTEPLKGIIDKLNKEGKVPHNIIVSMHHLNSLSTFGAHPKDFDPKQVRPVILDLTTVIEWYYRYAEKTGVVDEKTDESVQSTSGDKIKAGKYGKTRKKVMFTSMLVIVLAVIISIVLIKLLGGDKSTLQEPIDSIAILPFENYAGDEVPDYLTAGIHSSLISNMGQVGELRITGSTSSRKYSDVDMSISEIASELNVDAVIEGDLISAGDSINMHMRLIRAGENEEQIWTGEYLRDISQILVMYNQITKQVVEELKIKLTSEEEILLNEAKTVRKDAYDNYMKGRKYWNRLGKEDLQRAIDYFKEAIKTDPEWAAPYAGLAQAWVGMAQFGYAKPETAMSNIYSNLNKAIELNPNFLDSHFINGLVSVWTAWDWDKGEKEFKKALNINPNDVMSRIYYAHLMMILKRNDEAQFHSQMAVELDPKNPLILALSSFVDLSASEKKSALEKSEAALSIDPSHPFALNMLEYSAYANDDFERSINTLIRIKPELGEEAHKAMAEAYKETGYKAAIDTMINHILNYSMDNYVSYPDLADYYFRVGKKEKAIECFYKGYEMHDPNMPYITHKMVHHNKLKNNPQFISLVKKMNLPLSEGND